MNMLPGIYNGNHLSQMCNFIYTIIKIILSCAWCVPQSHYTKDYTSLGKVLGFQQVFAVMFNGCTGIMGEAA